MFAVFLYDLAYAYQITPKRVKSWQSYDVTSIFQDGGHRVGNLPPALVLVTTLKLGHLTPFRQSWAGT